MTSNNETPDESVVESEIDQDARDLRRGVTVNFLGYLLKIAVPVMMVLVIRLYGAEAVGLFTLALAALMFITRVGLLGLDKALLWWIPQQKPGSELFAWRSVVVTTTTIGAALSVIITTVAAPEIADYNDAPDIELPLRIMAGALVPMMLLELLLASTMGLKRMEPNVLVKETVLPISNVGLALLLYPLGLGTVGLAIAFIASYILSCLVAWAWWRRLFKERGSKDGYTETIYPPMALLRYAIPMWFSEMSNSFLQRMDNFAVGAFTDLHTVGIYTAVVQIANTIRSIRRSFDPIVLVITAEIGAAGAKQRLRRGLSYATYLVTATQLPILAFIIAFAQWLMPMYGEGFDAGINAVIILCTFWVFNSAVSLAGIVVAAYGYSKLTLANVIIAIVAQAITLVVFVPAYGIDGAAIAVGIAYSVQSIVQMIQMRWLTGSWNTTSLVAWPMIIATAAALASFAAWLVVPDPNALPWRIAIFCVFLVVYGIGAGAHIKYTKRRRSATSGEGDQQTQQEGDA